jgi:uncharacterized protein YjbI with pentapeptide repeats
MWYCIVMANEEHLEILKQGPDIWNSWRASNPHIQPDLSEANLTNINLSNFDLSYSELYGANISHAKLGFANLRYSNLYTVVSEYAEADSVDFSCANLFRVNFTNANLNRADFFNADLRMAKLISAKLREAKLHNANMRNAYMPDADLRSATLAYADLQDAVLSNANLTGANLNNTNLNSAWLREADFTQAEIGCTSFGDNDLSKVKGLDTVSHRGPSTIGIDTIYWSRGNIPEVFLRGAGVPNDFVTYMRSLVGRPIEFYSCFISYSTKNSDFAERLYADLQSREVRCWFAPESLKIGDKFRQRIDESIWHYDKLLLILSECSISSPWVEDEVEGAIEREHQEKRLVLFPIRIDNAIFTCNQAWAASLRRQRHIGDFTSWKDHDSYLKALNLLMKDLKSEESSQDGT